MESAGCIEALNIALSNRTYVDRILIHHSDRGVQYCSSSYVDILTENSIGISMTQNGSPYENALAERMNGIIKSEFIPRKLFRNHDEARKTIDKIITAYNGQRPHASLNYLTPEVAHTVDGEIPKRWKKYKRSTESIES